VDSRRHLQFERSMWGTRARDLAQSERAKLPWQGNDDAPAAQSAPRASFAPQSLHQGTRIANHPSTHSTPAFGLVIFQVLGTSRSSCCWSVESQAKPSRSPRRHITTSTMASLGEELLNIVNRLQDLVFNTIGNDSLDLPQIVRSLTR
jgi:hypothetical protein